MSESNKTIDLPGKMMADRSAQCSQAIFTTYGPLFAPDKVDFDTCMEIASAFGGGINMTGNVCGAITGALMALGLKFGGSPMEKDMSDIATNFIEDFKAIHGTIICRELIGDILNREKALEESEQQAAFMKCMKCVGDVSKLVSEYLD